MSNLNPRPNIIINQPNTALWVIIMILLLTIRTCSDDHIIQMDERITILEQQLSEKE